MLAFVSILTNICLMCLFCMRPMDGVSGPSMRFCIRSFSFLVSMFAAWVQVLRSGCLIIMRISRTYGG